MKTSGKYKTTIKSTASKQAELPGEGKFINAAEISAELQREKVMEERKEIASQIVNIVPGCV